MNDDALVRTAAAAIGRGSKSFAAAARLFDRETRESAILLYAWCRHCDDVIDGQELGGELGRAPPVAIAGTPAERLADLERQTRAALAGEPVGHPAFAALARVAARSDIPLRYPLEHLEGFRKDVEGREYATIDDTLAYCYGVAGVVGIMMAHLMGVRDRAVMDRACDLGLAFQLTNIARDLVPDADVGRVYLPRNWLAEAGIPANEVADPRHRGALAKLADRLVATAEPYYASAFVGIAALPLRSAWAIATARGVYREIGIAVRRRGRRAWDERVSTSAADKLRLVAAGGLTALRRKRIANAARPNTLWHRPP